MAKTAKTLHLNKRQYKILVSLIIIAIILVSSRFNPQTKKAVMGTSTNEYQVVSVEDGDTITVLMNRERETIRFIGVDTPETKDPRKQVQCFGKAAANFTKSKLNGATVRLETDPLSTNRDRYDRLLRYVYKQDELVNAELIKQGYGFAVQAFPFTKMEEFMSYEKSAENSSAGLWGSCEVKELDSGQKQTNN
ncbi:MAG: thermonuclease family protein [Candidatus Saccharimonadales bacterium]